MIVRSRSLTNNSTVIVCSSTSKGERAGVLLQVLQSMEDRPTSCTILLRRSCLGWFKTVIECSCVCLLSRIVRGLSAYKLLVSYRAWVVIIYLAIAMESLIRNAIINVTREEES